MRPDTGTTAVIVRLQPERHGFCEAGTRNRRHDLPPDARRDRRLVPLVAPDGSCSGGPRCGVRGDRRHPCPRTRRADPGARAQPRRCRLRPRASLSVGQSAHRPRALRHLPASGAASRPSRGDQADCARLRGRCLGSRAGGGQRARGTGHRAHFESREGAPGEAGSAAGARMGHAPAAFPRGRAECREREVRRIAWRAAGAHLARAGGGSGRADLPAAAGAATARSG